MEFRNTGINELLRNITEFRIVKGRISSDPTLYEFEIKEKGETKERQINKFKYYNNLYII